MRNKRKKPDGIFILKICEYCNAKFYAKRSTARFCSDACRTYNYLEKNRSDNPFSYDPNQGNILAPGTYPSQEMPEDKLVFVGDLASLYCELSTYYLSSPGELDKEKEAIEFLEPYSDTKKWEESMTQIWTDKYSIEIFRIFHAEYKLYAWRWGDGNPRPGEH